MTEVDGSFIRRASAAGSFYPSGAGDLAKQIAQMFSEVDKVPIDGRPIALIAPHAGYIYSGKTAAKAYKLLEGEDYDRVVIVSPSHTVFFKGVSVYGGTGYQTPLGLVETDQEMVEKISSINPSSVYKSNMGHSTGEARGEHSLEVHLPFLQVALLGFKLVAIVMGDQEEDSIDALGEVLYATLKGTNSLIIASTDLSHFHPEADARKLDFAVQETIEKFDPDALQSVISSGKGEACGSGPVAAVMKASKKLGGRRVRFLDYSTSGNVTGDFEEVVGYLSAAIIADRQKIVKKTAPVIGARAAMSASGQTLTDRDRRDLISIAQVAIESRLLDRPHDPLRHPRLEDKRGLFVTLKIDGNLRGCIGLVRATEPLYKAVADMAVAAAFDDPRFPPVGATELSKLDYEISVLTPLTRVRDISEIVAGRHGLMIKLDLHSGLLLPQVAAEEGWTAVEFLQQTCLKAGLPKNAYKDKFAEIYKFGAEIVS